MKKRVLCLLAFFLLGYGVSSASHEQDKVTKKNKKTKLTLTSPVGGWITVYGRAEIMIGIPGEPSGVNSFRCLEEPSRVCYRVRLKKGKVRIEINVEDNRILLTATSYTETVDGSGKRTVVVKEGKPANPDEFYGED